MDPMKKTPHLTGESHWKNRPEKNWGRFQFHQPYEKGLGKVHTLLRETNFDPATLWQWGTMMAMALINVLKKAEKKFGSEGQQLVLDSLKEIGRDVGDQILAGTEIPPEMPAEEWISFYATVINRIAYASLESPEIGGDGPAFHIDWCPHQDMYGPMDCRVQRYFVQGMIDAGMEFALSQGRQDIWDVSVKTTIPNGASTCFFTIRKGGEEDRRRWEKYTAVLEQRALKQAERE